MSTPAWADAQLSADLKRLCAQGERQEIEFKASLPKQVSDLATEVAAFASSNAGQILLGVADDGSVIGLPGCHDQAGRDLLTERLAGIFRQIKPSVLPALKWAVDGDHVVCVLQIPKGSAPMYYVGHRPYVRRLTSSRPAEPDEVVDAVRAFLADGEPVAPKDPEATKVRSDTATALAELLRWSDLDLEDRNFSPWSDYWVSEGREIGTKLRRVSSQEAAERLGLTSQLRQAASAVEKVVRTPRTYGGGRDFDELIEAAGNLARRIHAEHIAPVTLDEQTERQLTSQISFFYSRLTDAWALAAEDPFGEALGSAINEAAIIGRALHEWSFYPSKAFVGPRGSDIRKIGKDLAALRFERIYYDGGESQRKVIALGSAATDALLGWKEADTKAGEPVEQVN